MTTPLPKRPATRLAAALPLPLAPLLVLLLAMAAALPAAHAMDSNTHEWGADYTRVTFGAKGNVQYNLYRRSGDAEHVYIELINRNEDAVKVDLRVVPGHSTSTTGPGLVAYVQGNSYWPAGAGSSGRKIACTLGDPEVMLLNVTTGCLEEEQVVETGADGQETISYKYRFTPVVISKRDQRRRD